MYRKEKSIFRSKNYLIAALVLLVTNWSGQAFAGERPAAGDLVDKADTFRQPFDGSNLKVRLTSYRVEKQHDETNYHVWASGNEKSLVAMLNPKVRGQKVLMLPKGLWLHMPNSRRAIRITPMQRLMGQASYGDITQLRMGGLYKAAYDSANPEGTVEGKNVWNLQLSSIKTNATYTKINLSIAKDSGLPVTAEFFLQSGKLLKKAVFGPLVKADGSTFISTVTFFDSIKANRKTIMTISEVKKKNFAGTDFSVRALARWKP
ncbi:MAG TPA: outer membrane lipoprotein-sorting protein [Rhodospirillales bacterium]|nr:outer membrane lipoprotein-sorting protein [Rhodospirillales bacterium]